MITQQQADEAVRNARHMQTKAATRHPRSRLGDAYELTEVFQAGRLLPDVIAALQRVENPVGVVSCKPTIQDLRHNPIRIDKSNDEIQVVLEITLTL